MTSPTNRARPPAAFTLIELLVVIAIIAILVSLTTAAVIRALRKGPEAQTRTDIGDLDMALAKLKSQFNLQYLPSRLHLSKTNNYGATALDIDSKTFLQARFGRDCCNSFRPLGAGQLIDWNGDGQNEELFLEGEQVLVFLLGGIPQTGNGVIGMTGFSNNSANPAAARAARAMVRSSSSRPNRLRLLTSPPSYVPASFHVGTGGGTGTFPVYLDAYARFNPGPWGNGGTPLLFFSGYGAEGGGNYLKYGGPDTTIAGVTPYITQAAPTIQFANPGTWQIISAGRGRHVRPRRPWNPATGYGNGVGADDQANFSPRTLGFAAN